MSNPTETNTIPDDESKTIITLNGGDAAVGIRPNMVAEVDGSRQAVKLVAGSDSIVLTIRLSESEAEELAASILEVVGD